jgi:hypothetical protein
MTNDALDFGPTRKQITPGTKVFGRYELQQRIAPGRLGEVWQAKDERLGLNVAIKIISGFSRYHAVLSQMAPIMDLTHPNIARVYDFTGDEDQCGIIMELIEGQPLHELLRNHKTPWFETREIETWTRQLFTALQFAWSNGHLVHGDIRLPNLYITNTHSLKIAEFYRAPMRVNHAVKEDESATSTFSLPCLSPQLLAGEQPTHTDDLYAATACLYELLTGRPVFPGGNVLVQIQRKVPPSITERRKELGLTGTSPVPATWENLIARGLEKESTARPADAAQALALLEAPTSSSHVPGTASLGRRLLGPRSHEAGSINGRRKPWLLAAILGGPVAAGLLIYTLAVAPTQKALAERRAAIVTLTQQDQAPDVDASARAAAWSQFLTLHAASPISFTQEDESMNLLAGERALHWRTEANNIAEKKAAAQLAVESATRQLSRAIDSTKADDAAAKINNELAAARATAWSKVLADHKQPGHPDTEAYLVLLTEAEKYQQDWEKKVRDHQALLAEQKLQAEQAMAKSKAETSSWLEKRENDWTTITAMDTTTISPALKLQNIENLLVGLQDAPLEAQARATELRFLAEAAKTLTLQQLEASIPKEPQPPDTLLAQTAAALQPVEVQKALLKRVQTKLIELKLYEEKADGSHGPKSHAALIEFQRQNRLMPTATLDPETMKALGLDQVTVDELTKESTMERSTASTNTSRSSGGGTRKRAPQPKKEEEGTWIKIGQEFRKIGERISTPFKNTPPTPPTKKKK